MPAELIETPQVAIRSDTSRYHYEQTTPLTEPPSSRRWWPQMTAQITSMSNAKNGQPVRSTFPSALGMPRAWRSLRLDCQQPSLAWLAAQDLPAEAT